MTTALLYIFLLQKEGGWERIIAMGKKPLRVGFDFDGVIAYNPARIIRAPISYIKRNVFGVKKLNFFYPSSAWQRLFWVLVHDSSVFPAKGIDLFRRAVDQRLIEAHLVTARFSFLDNHLDRWLTKYDLKQYFTSININAQDQQPHIFKQQMVQKLSLKYFIEDNLDIVEYVQPRVSTQVYWIYNILDRNYPYPHKFPYLEKALADILAANELVVSP